MSTIKEQAKATAIRQLNLAVRDLIRSMNAANDFNISIVEQETESSWFDFSLEYPPYEDSPQKFQRRVSNLEAEEIAWNIFYIIKDCLGYNYNEDNYYVAPEVRSFSDKLFFNKTFRFKIGFIEKNL